MREAVTAIFKYKNYVFMIERQNYLRAFPGYTAFPGGKVDESDREDTDGFKYENIEPYLLKTLYREIDEELEIDILNLIEQKKITSIKKFAMATTPKFNPYRYETYFFLIDLEEKMDITADLNESRVSGWYKINDLLDEFDQAEHLMVPPTINCLRYLRDGKISEDIYDLTPTIDEKKEVYSIESISGVKQFMPLSKTFPPALRTNSFLIGDEGSLKVLIDPSPKDDNEYEKLKYSLKGEKIDVVFISHHHPDHHEFSVQLAKDFGAKIGINPVVEEIIKKEFRADYFEDLKILYFNDGDTITKSLGQDVLVMEVSGHAKGQLGLYPKNKNWFFVGDLIQTVGTVVVGGDYGDMKVYLESLQKVVDLDPKFVIPSHGISIGGIHKLKMTIKHRLMREEHIKTLLERNKSIDEIYEIVYPGLREGLKPYAIATIKAHIKKLTQES